MLLFSVGAFSLVRGRGRAALFFRSLCSFSEMGAAVAGRAEGHDWPLRRVPGLAWIPLGRPASLWPFPARFPFVFSLTPLRGLSLGVPFLPLWCSFP